MSTQLTHSLGEKQKLNLVFPAYYLNSTDGWEHDIRRVLCCDMDKFNPLLAFDLELGWELDPDTSLRVHIEDRTYPCQGFQFHTVRNLAMILLLFGPKIDSMVSSKATQELTYETGETWRGPKPLPDIYGELPVKPDGGTPREMASYILHNCPTIESICQTMAEFLSTLKLEFRQSFTVDFSGLLTNPPRRPNESAYQTREPTSESTQEYYASQIRADRGPSIEFKHQPGTFDAAHTIHWIRFLSALVEFADHIGLESLVLFLGLNENGYEYIYPSDSLGNHTKLTATEWDLKNWDFVRWHPTLARNPRRDPPNYADEAGFQHTYPISGLIAAMDMVGIGLEIDTTDFWMKALEVSYNPNMKSDSEPELPAIKRKHGEDSDEMEGLEAMESLSMTRESLPGCTGSEMDWIPASYSESQSVIEVRGRKRRRCD